MHIIPVSYTNLDVYKRQLKNIDTVRYGVTFKLQNDGSIKANGTVTGTGTCTLAELRLRPGKYTYSGLSGQPDNSIVMQLFEDVYKRQVLHPGDDRRYQPAGPGKL